MDLCPLVTGVKDRRSIFPDRVRLTALLGTVHFKIMTWGRSGNYPLEYTGLT